MINIFRSATNAPRFRLPSAYATIVTLTIIILIQISVIAFMLDAQILFWGAIANTVFAVYQGVRNG